MNRTEARRKNDFMGVKGRRVSIAETLPIRKSFEKVQTPPELSPRNMPLGTTSQERKILVVLAILLVLGVIGLAVL
jgi:hypothetical protein